MLRKLFAAALALTLILPEALLAQQAAGQPTGATSRMAVTTPSPAQTSAQAQNPQSARPQPPARRRSYEREVRPRSHSSISKKEVAFMAGIAGTSMGIGALAGGATGLAIGSIVGGWGAYVGHRLWKWIR